MQQDNPLKWEFAETGGGDEIGINDPVISNFLGDVATKLVREALQNSIDASVIKPVIVKFNMVFSKVSKIPGIDQLNTIYNLCMEHWKNKKDVNKVFASMAAKTRRDFDISVLKISDYNTRGLTPDDYYSLFQVVGGSSKIEGAGGSFGLGKGAYFGASGFRMVFVSSKYDDDKYYFAGKTRLVSFVDNDKIMQSSGTYGYPSQKPVTLSKDIPDIFKRQENGTDFFIYDYLYNGRWEEEIIKSVLKSFWYAIMHKDLIVEVKDIIISSESLPTLFIKYFSKSDPNNDYQDSPYPFFLACNNVDTELIEENLPTLGQVKLYILKNESFPKEIVYIRRTGMVIQKKGRNAPYGYAGVFVCENIEGNEILRKMENPEHDKWKSDIAIASGKLDKKKATEAIKELNIFVVNALRGLQEMENGDVVHVKELDRYLWLPVDDDEFLLGGGGLGESGRLGDKEAAIEVTKVDIQKPEIISKKEKLNIEKKQVKGRPGDDPKYLHNGGHGGSGNRKKNGTEDPDGDLNLVQVLDFKCRSFAELNDHGEYEHTLIIKAPGSNNLAKLIVRVGTDNSLDDVGFKSVIYKSTKNKCDFEGNIIKNIELKGGGNNSLLVKFDDDNKYSLNFLAYEHK